MVFSPFKIGMALLTTHDNQGKKPDEFNQLRNRIANDYAQA